MKGLALLKGRAYQKCIRVSVDALEKGLQPGPFNKLLGVVYLYQGRLDLAARRLRKAHENLEVEAEVMLAMVDTYQQIGDFKGLRLVVKEIFCKKGEVTWKDYIKNAAEENALNAYKIRCSVLLPAIGKGACLMKP